VIDVDGATHSQYNGIEGQWSLVGSLRRELSAVPVLRSAGSEVLRSVLSI